jgi:hypothetical protein
MAFVLCDAGRRVATDFVAQWNDVPEWSNIPTLADKIRFLRYTSVKVRPASRARPC